METMKTLYSQETEQAVLGCMFMDGDAAQMGKGSLVPDDFYTPLYRVIFEAMQGVEAVDMITVSNELQRMGQWERVGLEWLKKTMDSVSTSVNLKNYIEELKRLSFLRNCVRFGHDVIDAAREHDIGRIDKAISNLNADGYGVGEISTFSDALEAYIKNLAAIRASGRGILGMATGFVDIDSMLGGLRDGSLNILAARPSMGKSALALDIARNAQKAMKGEKEKVVFISLEMTKEELAARGYTAEYLIENDNFAMGGGQEETWLETLRQLEKNSADIDKGIGRMIINDTGGMNMEKIRAYLHGLKTQGVQIRMIIVDYLQFIVTKGVNMVQEMGEVSRGLKNIAKDYECPVVALSQLSRAPESRADHRPILSDLRESGNIEQDADVVMFLYRDEYYFPDSEKKGMAELNIAKQRNGPTGAVDLRWIANCTTFRSAERWHKTTDEPPEKFTQEKL